MPATLLLTRDLEQPFPQPQWPVGIVLAGFGPADASDCHQVLRRAYAEGGGSVPAGFEEWWRATSSDPEFDPELVLLARTAEGALAGLALCWTTSFVKDLVVDPERRRQGIAEALLLAAFAEFRRRGHSRIGLKLQADNGSGARRLYERLGFVLG
jgi:ribosomal protein S18 acetylase RimI-like enzyme